VLTVNNLYLIGMPGCGKSTVGKRFAKANGLPFVDLDAAIVETEGMRINDIFAKYGEGYFRAAERAALVRVSACAGTVVATGGGIVLNPENIATMKETGVVVYLDTPIDVILKNTDFKDRPLLKDDVARIHRLYDERRGKYLSADCVVACGGDLGETVNRVRAAVSNL
jgi:shikimate kinase